MGDELADQNYDLNVVGSIKHFTIPYGVCKTDSEDAD